MHRDSLIRRFADAGLKLEISDRPIVGGLRGEGASSIVQIDIRRSTNGSRRIEWFRIFPGDDTNRIEVVGTDKRIGQVVLMVHEPVREFTEAVSKWSIRDVDLTQPGWRAEVARTRGVRETDILNTAKGILVKRRTSSQKRHFLCGLDERQLFIAQLPKAVSTVRDAHACLKRTELVLAEGKGIKATRQGEWFLVEATKEELDLIDLGLKKNLLVIEHSVPIGPFTVGGLRGSGRVRQGLGNRISEPTQT